jgi:hypothetical protein
MIWLLAGGPAIDVEHEKATSPRDFQRPIPARAKGILRAVQRGDVIRLDDTVTGFDLGKQGRPYCVVAVYGDPPAVVYVVPRSTQPQSQGVATPSGVLPGLNDAGRFLWRPYAVAVTDVTDAPQLGLVPEPYRTRVLEQVNLAEFDVS